MSYKYQEWRPTVFSEDGAAKLTRTLAEKAIAVAGAVRIGKILAPGDQWAAIACVDYLVEKRYLHEVTGSDVMGQDRVFVAGHNLER